MKQKSKRFGKRFSSPYKSWPCGHRRNPARGKHQSRRKRKAVVVVGK